MCHFNRFSKFNQGKGKGNVGSVQSGQNKAVVFISLTGVIDIFQVWLKNAGEFHLTPGITDYFIACNPYILEFIFNLT